MSLSDILEQGNKHDFIVLQSLTYYSFFDYDDWKPFPPPDCFELGDYLSFGDKKNIISWGFQTNLIIPNLHHNRKVLASLVLI